MGRSQPRRLIVGITGASGTIYGVRLLQMLKGSDIETHLVMSRWAARTLVHETSFTPETVQALASVVHPIGDQGASISSGSFVTMGMISRPAACERSPRSRTALGQSHPSRCRRGPERAPPTGARGARGAAQRDPSREHAEAVADGRRHRAAGAGLLLPSADHRRDGQLHGRSTARPVRPPRRCGSMVGPERRGERTAGNLIRTPCR